MAIGYDAAWVEDDGARRGQTYGSHIPGPMLPCPDDRDGDHVAVRARTDSGHTVTLVEARRGGGRWRRRHRTHDGGMSRWYYEDTMQHERCGTCDGAGTVEGGTPPDGACPDCGGRGRGHMQRADAVDGGTVYIA